MYYLVLDFKIVIIFFNKDFMLKTEIILLTNNIVIPFQELAKEKGLNFVELNKLFATQSLAEHGLGFLINIYKIDDPNDEWGGELLKRIIFDTGGPNATFLHNADIRGYGLHDVDVIILSHWHYDHTGGLCKILERIECEIPVITHKSARLERFFKRTKDVRDQDLKGKTREQISSLLSSSKIVNQLPIDESQINSLTGRIEYHDNDIELMNIPGLKIIISGEIKRNHIEEDFHGFYSLQEGVLQEDKIMDDKCLIFEFEENAVILNGCCHSGLMNTIDHVKSISKKPISHIIGGFHMAGASDKSVENTIEYLSIIDKHEEPLYLFPLHCTGERFFEILGKKQVKNIEAYNASVGTVFHM